MNKKKILVILSYVIYNIYISNNLRFCKINKNRMSIQLLKMLQIYKIINRYYNYFIIKNYNFHIINSNLYVFIF